MTIEAALDFLKSQLDLHGAAIPADAVREIRKWLHHDEYEMAFEALALELMQAGIEPKDGEAADWLRHATTLGLDRESVLDPQFATRLRRWARTPHQQ